MCASAHRRLRSLDGDLLKSNRQGTHRGTLDLNRLQWPYFQCCVNVASICSPLEVCLILRCGSVTSRQGHSAVVPDGPIVGCVNGSSINRAWSRCAGRKRLQRTRLSHQCGRVVGVQTGPLRHPACHPAPIPAPRVLPFLSCCLGERALVLVGLDQRHRRMASSRRRRVRGAMARRVCRAVLILPDWVHCPRPGKHVQSRDGLLVWAASIAWIASAPEVHGLLCLVQGKENDTAKPGAAHAQRCAPRPARRLPALPVPDGALLAQRWPSGVCHMHLPKATTPGERVRVGLSCRHPPPPSRMPPSLSLSRSLSPPFSLLGRMLALVGRPYARPGPAPPEALTAKFCTGASSWQDAFVSGTKPANVLSGVAHRERQAQTGAGCILRASCVHPARPIDAHVPVTAFGALAHTL